MWEKYLRDESVCALSCPQNWKELLFQHTSVQQFSLIIKLNFGQFTHSWAKHKRSKLERVFHQVSFSFLIKVIIDRTRPEGVFLLSRAHIPQPPRYRPAWCRRGGSSLLLGCIRNVCRFRFGYWIVYISKHTVYFVPAQILYNPLNMGSRCEDLAWCMTLHHLTSILIGKSFFFYLFIFIQWFRHDYRSSSRVQHSQL